jgi:hypothetical protein
MRIAQFSVATSRTINLGNFESLRIEGSVVVDLSENDNIVMARGEAQKQLRQLLEDTYRHQYEERQERKRVANK